MTSALCPWCGAPFTPAKRGGHAKRFCSPACRNAWNGAARALGRQMETNGVLSLRQWWDQHQNASLASCTLRRVASKAFGAGG